MARAIHEVRSNNSLHEPSRSIGACTLVEVIAIIGVLVGLLLPAVQAANESAGMAPCGNNIEQIVDT